MFPDLKNLSVFFWGEESFCETMKEKNPDVSFWMGEYNDTPSGKGRPSLIHNGNETKLESWRKAHDQLTIGQEAISPNLIHLKCRKKT